MTINPIYLHNMSNTLTQEQRDTITSMVQYYNATGRMLQYYDATGRTILYTLAYFKDNSINIPISKFDPVISNWYFPNFEFLYTSNIPRFRINSFLCQIRIALYNNPSETNKSIDSLPDKSPVLYLVTFKRNTKDYDSKNNDWIYDEVAPKLFSSKSSAVRYIVKYVLNDINETLLHDDEYVNKYFEDANYEENISLVDYILGAYYRMNPTTLELDYTLREISIDN